MLINEVCKKCSLTKKAIEYYMEQGLIAPTVQKNGYRDFSEDDIEKLKKISVLRRLGLSVADIHIILSEHTTVALNMISRRKSFEIIVLQEKQKLIQELAEQQEAFHTIIAFLDNTQFDIPDDLQEYLDEIAVHLDETFVENLSVNISKVIRDTEGYIAEHREEIEHYIAYKQSREYKTTPAYRLEMALKQFNSVSGYNDVFIPAMCRLSGSYQKYYEGLQKADEKFLQEYP